MKVEIIKPVRIEPIRPTSSTKRPEAKTKVDSDQSIMKRIKEKAYDQARESQLHAIPSIANRSKPHVIRLMWLVFLLISTGFCALFVYQGITNYLEFETISRISVVNEIPSVFPAISFCNINPFVTNYSDAYVTRYLKENNYTYNDHSSMSTLSYDYFRYFLASSVLSSNLSDAEKKLLGVPMDEFINGCSVNGIACDDKFEWYFDGYYGNCYRFNSGRNLTGQRYDSSELLSSYKSGPINGVFTALYIAPPYSNNSFSGCSGARFAVHNSSRRPTYFEGYDAQVGTMTKIAIKRTFKYRLPPPYSDCVTSNLIGTYGSIFTDMFFKNNLGYTQTDCFMYCFQRKLADTCNCYDPTFSEMKFNKTACWSLKELQCVVNLFNKFFQSDVDKHCTRECPLECESVSYDVVVTTSDWPTTYYCELLLNTSSSIRNRYANYSSLEEKCAGIKSSMVDLSIYYDTLEYTLIEEGAKMDLQDLISDMGGLAGLFVGYDLSINQTKTILYNYLLSSASFLSLVELFEFILEAAFILIARPKPRRQVTTA